MLIVVELLDVLRLAGGTNISGFVVKRFEDGIFFPCFRCFDGYLSPHICFVISAAGRFDVLITFLAEISDDDLD